MNVFLTLEGDDTGLQTGRAVSTDDPELLARIAQGVSRGHDGLRSWALSTGGRIIDTAGGVVLELPAAALADLPGVRRLYQDATGATLSVGVGKTLSQSAKALLAAKLRGRDRVVLYGDDVEQEVAAAKEQPEKEKIVDEYLRSEKPGLSAGISKMVLESPPLVKDEGSAAGTADHGGGVSKPARAQPHHQTAPGPAAGAPVAPELTHAAEDFEKHFRAAADAQEGADRAAQARNSEDMDALKQQVAKALEGLRGQLPVLGQIKAAYPETYKSVMGLVQSVVVLARGLQAGDDELAKREQGAKVWRSTGWGTDVVTIPSAGHPQRDAYDRAFLEGVAHQYAGGDTTRLKPLKVPVAKLTPGNSGRGVANKDRFNLYRRMYAAGDQAPPLVVQRTKTGYQILDGTHRYEAAKAAGATHVRAVELAKEELGKDAPNPAEHAPGAPVGTVHNGKLKVQHADGDKGWKGVRAGMITGLEPGGVGGGGANSHAVSSREPSSR